MADRQPTEETEVWSGRSSQATNLGAFALAAVVSVAILAAGWWFAQPVALVGLVLPVGYSLFVFLRVRARLYTLTTERLKVTDGILNKRTDSLELYRVKDLIMLQPLALRLMRLGNVVLTTSDQTTPLLVLRAVHEPTRVNDLVRLHVERQRDRKRVTEVDLT